MQATSGTSGQDRRLGSLCHTLQAAQAMGAWCWTYDVLRRSIAEHARAAHTASTLEQTRHFLSKRFPKV